MHVAYGSSFQHISMNKKLNKPNKRCIQSEQKISILKIHSMIQNYTFQSDFTQNNKNVKGMIPRIIHYWIKIVV